MIDRMAFGTRRFDVAVIGRGAVGMAAALALAQASLRVAIVGPEPDAQSLRPPAGDDDWDSRIYALSPASRSLLARLHAWDAMPPERIAPVHDMRVMGAVPDAPLAFSAYDSGVEALAWILENRSIVRALHPALRYAGVTVLDAELEQAQVDERAVRLALSDGSSIEASLLVGADGGRSRVREQCGFTPHVIPYDQTAVVANFRCERPHLDTAYQWFGIDGILALLPLPADAERRSRVSMVWSVPHAAAAQIAALPPEALAARVAQAAGGQLGALQTITPPQRFPLQLLTLSASTAPRVALVGDAAHMMHPLAGQGMNVGLGDVIELARVMAAREPQRDPGDALLLRRYDRGRREAVAAMQATTDGLHRLFYRAVPAPLAALRDLGWQLVGRSGWLKRRLIAHAMR